MLKVAIDYSKTVIYKIVCKDLNVNYKYVGQTTNLNKRRNQHKTACNNESDKRHHLYVYQNIRDNGGWENWIVVEVEKYPCKDFNEAGKRERFHIEQFGNLNKVIPTRTDKEYRETHKTHISEYQKIHYQENKKTLSQQQKIYRENNREAIQAQQKIYSENNKDKQKTRQHRWYQKNKNKEAFLEKSKIYRENNKEKIMNRMMRVVKCECGTGIASCSLIRHKKTKKHINLMENLPKSE